MQPIEYGFNDRLAMSQSESSNANIKDILLREIPSALSVTPAHELNDRKGIDWWVECRNGKHLSVDCKVRSQDWSVKPNPKDDIALETWSVVEKNVVGWTRDPNKQTDYILWLWQDTGRWMLVPFQLLCGTFSKNWKRWRAQFQTNRQFTPNRNYHSECCFVPRKVLWNEMYRSYAGDPKNFARDKAA